MKKSKILEYVSYIACIVLGVVLGYFEPPTPLDNYTKACDLFKSENYLQAAELLQKAANEDFIFAHKAQKLLGICYLYGLGVEKDLPECAKWMRKAAEQGDADAQCALGLLYEKGLGVEKDPAEAARWYWKSAEQGYQPAVDALCHLPQSRAG